jgi:D-sedoheptulose 7-phosphate isomerase
MTQSFDGYRSYLADLDGVLTKLPLDAAKRAADILFDAYQNDQTVFTFGNGGSAALASHLAADLGKATHIPGPDALRNAKRMRVVSLTDNVPLITAWANDADFENVFAGQMENFVKAHDVAFAISGSGNSKNVLNALDLARRAGAIAIGMTGCGGGKMKALLDCALVVESHSMQQVEDAHLILAHLIFLDVKARIADAKLSHPYSDKS